MSTLFLKILNMSLNASWLILAVIIARFLLKKAPKWASCLLWGLVAFRLICPFSIHSILSLLPSAEIIPDNIMAEANPRIYSGVNTIDNAVNPIVESVLSPKVVSSVNPVQVIVDVAGTIWAIGFCVMLIYSFISILLLRRRVSASVKLSDGIYECDEVASPFILGIIRPIIYVPSGMDSNTLDYVTAHEKTHLKRKDHYWKPLGFFLLSVYWFNPLCWISYILLCRDIESACDEKVIRDKDTNYMAAYSQALLDCSINRRVIAACPLAFGETDVKGRIKGILNYKKPAFWIVVTSILVCIIVAVCFITSPKGINDLSDATSVNVASVSISEVTEHQPATAVMPVAGEISEDEIISENTAEISGETEYSNKAYITAESSGIVTKKGFDEGTGYYLEITDENGNISEFTGLYQIYVNEGDEIEAGDKLAVSFDFSYSAADEFFENNFSAPTDSLYISRTFDPNEHPETDIPGEVGTPVLAVCDATVYETGYDDNAGNYIVLTTEFEGRTITVVYSHFDEIKVNANESVNAGDEIGTMGNTGNSTGSHLGIQLAIDGVPVDIEGYI